MALKILTWNISYGYGMGSEGTADYQPRPASHFESAIESIAELIREVGADIVLLQEVDFGSKRSHFTEQLDRLARMTGLLYRHEVISWNHPYVPFPGLKPERQFGRVKSGGGILSRFPVKSVITDLLPKPKENSRLYNWFYLNRYLEIVDIESYRFCNLHLEAFSGPNRELHLVKLQDRMKDYEVDIAGGDFNGQISLNPEFMNEFQAVPTPEPSFPSNGATEYLDGFILKKKRIEKFTVKTLNSSLVSDHFPLLLEID